MKFRLNPHFSASELKTLKKVSIVSTSLCALVVGGFWGFHTVLTQIEEKKKAQSFPQYEERSLLPIDIESNILCADNFLLSDNPQKAIPHLQRVIALRKNDTETRLKLAKAYFESGYYANALEQYSFLDEDQNCPDSIRSKISAGKGICLFYLGKHEESMQILKDCLNRFPKAADAACFIGQIETSKIPLSDSALSYFELAIRIDSSYVEPWYQLARYYMFKENYPKARELLLKALDLNPLHEKSHSRLGMIYYYMGNSELAKKSYLTALALNPRDFNTRYNLGELYYSVLADTQNAFREFNEALKENPAHVDANFKAGLICLQNNMTKEAIRYLKSALQPDQSNIRILFQLAVAFERLGSKNEAIDVYKKILTIDDLNTIAKEKLRLLSLQL
jgi:tetratricopeptide (TPR) repeat protein